AITGIGAARNIISGNFVGLDMSGSFALANSQNGVYLGNSANLNMIGGDQTGAGNVISGNARAGVYFSATASNDIVGNFICPDISGSIARGNGTNGIVIVDSTATNIGGRNSGSRSIISGNGFSGAPPNEGHGIAFWGSSTANFVEGNYIGTDVSGMLALGNARDGIFLQLGAGGNTIGGTAAGTSNIIAANGWHGIEIDSTYNTVSGNYVGLGVGPGAWVPLGNGKDGVFLDTTAQNNTIRATSAAAIHLISS